ncbi:hypothetical protein CDD83_9056 [Cordyceps sp. RAO-2017]|nr:hypothetical protein CDD83_9056 [Cordyceps sp. RAO-2017]
MNSSPSRRPRAASPAPAISSASSLLARLFNRRLFLAVRFAFAFAAASILGAKVVHVYAHLDALAASDVVAYGISFFAQDVFLLLSLRLLLDSLSHLTLRSVRLFVAALVSLVILASFFFASISISFFLVTGTELHWRNAGVAGGSGSFGMLLTGLFSLGVVTAAILVVAWLAQDLCYIVSAAALVVARWPFAFVLSRIPCRRWRISSPKLTYQHVPQQDDVEGRKSRREDDDDDDGACEKLVPEQPPQSKWSFGLHLSVAFVWTALILTSLFRPNDSSLVFMSWTVPLMPLVDLMHSSPSLVDLVPSYGSDVNSDLQNRTALADPPHWPWLPAGEPLPGFEDWYENKEHYRASEDPLHISNLDFGVLADIRNKLADVKIRHVMLIKLESTRKDVFPIKKGGLIWERLLGNQPKQNTTPSVAATQRFSTLTPVANLLTGDFDDGFPHADRKPRGGINANNVHTTSTYTLKSLAGTLCGLYPLVADFNVEQSHHVYQPCLPHIFNAFNRLQAHKEGEEQGDDFTTFKWKSMFMQSVTQGYDKQDAEMPVLGFPPENFVSKESLLSGEGKFGKVNMTDINYYGMPEVAIQEYLRDAFASAKKNKERLFLSHLTSTTHHPFGMPETEEYIPLTSDKKLNDLSHYANAVGYVDRWIGHILKMLEEEGAADETLLVLVGDHGLSLPETGAVTPYYGGNVGNFHVPLVLSHPKLPHVDVDDAVVSLQILPTILDLLIESGSLAKPAKRAALDMLHNYEGQSLIRPQSKASRETGDTNWLFTVMNPGRATVAVRDAHRQDWRIIVPVIDDVEWRFTDTGRDPHEEEPTVAFSFKGLLDKVEAKYGVDAAKWAEAAAIKARWWVKENNKRWRYQAS